MQYIKDGWQKIKNNIDSISEVYSIEETIQLLLGEYYYKNYFGRAKNRTMICENPKLYKSIYYHTQPLEDMLKLQNTYKGKYNFKYRMIFLTENNGDLEKLKCECGKVYNWEKYCRHCPEPKKSFFGKKHTNITKNKMRVSTLKYIQSLKGKAVPRYNHNSIVEIEKVAKKLGITDLQHAENGGEYYIKELGYFVDGYSKEKNIVIEYDEKHHFDENGQLKQKDLIRQFEIEKLLSCNFIRVKHNEL
jgi:hypothetical protein